MLKGGLVLIWELHMNLVPTLFLNVKPQIFWAPKKPPGSLFLNSGHYSFTLS